MAGIREIGAPLQVVSDWLDAADRSGMPTDPRLWLDGPSSSYPACLAVKAAEEQGDPAPYLRRLREGFAMRRRRLDRLEAFVEEARAVEGLDVERFRIDAGSHSIVEKFGDDLERARGRLPSLDFTGEDGEGHTVTDVGSYDALRAAAVAAGAKPAGDWPLSVEAALGRFGALATVEVAALCDLPGPRAAAELWRLAAEWRVKPERALTGELWTLA
jgi:putative protein-disulfide isomerase